MPARVTNRPRKEHVSGVPRCPHSYYKLLGLTEPRCPECGRGVDAADPSSYALKPPYVAGRFWLTGLILSLGGGMLAFLFVVPFAGWGWAATLVVPFAAGALLGYAFRARFVVLPVLSLVVAVGFVFGLVSVSLAG